MRKNKTKTSISSSKPAINVNDAVADKLNSLIQLAIDECSEEFNREINVSIEISVI